MTMTVWRRPGQVFCRMSLHRELWWDWGYGFLGERPQRRGAILTSYQGYIHDQHDISLLMLISSIRMRQCSSGFSIEKLLSFPSYHTARFGREVIKHSPQLRSGELSSVSLKVKCLQKLFGIHLHRKAVSSPHLLIQSFISTHSLVFICILWAIIQYYFIYFVFKWFQLWPLGALLFDSWVPLTHAIIRFWFFFWTTSLLCGTTGCSSHLACCLPQS